MNAVTPESVPPVKPAAASGWRGRLAVLSLLTPQEARLLSLILGLLLLGLTVRFVHLRGETSTPIPRDPAASRLTRSALP